MWIFMLLASGQMFAVLTIEDSGVDFQMSPKVSGRNSNAEFESFFMCVSATRFKAGRDEKKQIQRCTHA